MLSCSECDKCSHSNVCAIKGALEKHQVELGAMPVSDSSDIEISLRCQHFQLKNIPQFKR